MNPTELYQALAYLFYAVAMADRKIEMDELAALQKEIQTHWPGQDGTIIAARFEGIMQHGLSAEEAFPHFEQYFLKHKAHIPSALRHTIFASADAIASAFARKNKSELVLLSKLQLLFTQP